LEGSGRGLVFRYYPGIYMDGLRVTTKNFRIAGVRAEI
jgi:hypothetical protein